MTVLNRPSSEMHAVHPSVRVAVQNEDSFATTLLVVACDTFGTEPFAKAAELWSPETIRMELRDELHVDISPTNLDRLMAAISLITSNDFYQRLPRFVQLCNILSGDDYDPRVFNPADTEELCWGITEAKLITGQSDETPFTDEIRAYIGAVLNMEGILHPPDVLRLADPEIVSLSSTELFDGDADLFEVAFQEQTRKRDELDQMVMANLQELFGQLANLRLRNGSTDDIIKRVMKGRQ